MDDVAGGTAQDWRDELSRRAQELRHRAETFDPETMASRDVIAIAVGVATTLGALVMGLGPGETVVAVPRGKTSVVKRKGVATEEQRVEQRRLTVVEKPMTAVIRNGKLTRRTRRQLHKQANLLQKEINRLDKIARAQGFVQQHSNAGNDAREAASQFGDTVGKRLAAVGAATAAAAAPLVERARNSDLPDQVRGGARQFADVTRERGSDFSERVREEFVPLIIDRAGKVQDRVRDDVAPQVSEQLSRVRDEFLPQVAERLQHVRDDVVPQVAERLQQVRDDVVPQVAERFQQVRDEFAPQAADAATRAGVQASALAATGAKASRRAAKNFAKTDPGEQLGNLADTLGKQAKRGRKQAASALSDFAAQLDPQPKRSANGLWIFAALAALGGLLFYIFQNEERRKKVTETAQSVVEQGREIVRDFQGYDEEF